MAPPNKIGDGRMAEKVIKAYAEGHVELKDLAKKGLITPKECAGIGIDKKRCDLLRSALEPGPRGVVSDDEAAELKKAGFSEGFIAGILKDNGAAALKARVKWLSDELVIADAGSPKEHSIIEELGLYGAYSFAAVDELFRRYHRTKSYTLYNLETEGIKAALVSVGVATVPKFVELAMDRSFESRDRRFAFDALELLGKDPDTAAYIVSYCLPRIVEPLNSEKNIPLVHILGSMREYSAIAVPRLVEILKVSCADCIQNREINNALSKIGTPAVPYLIDMFMSDNSDFNKSRVFMVFRSMGEKDAAPIIPYMIESVLTCGKQLKLEVLYTLSMIGKNDERVVELMTYLLSDPDIEIVNTALFIIMNSEAKDSAFSYAIHQIEKLRDDTELPNDIRDRATKALESILERIL